MSISSAPASATSRISRRRASRGPSPEGNPPATLATATPLDRSCSTATGTSWGYRQTAATLGTSGRSGSGRTAFAHIATIFPVVSVPSRVVRSMHRIARSSAHSFASRLMERARERRRPALEPDGVDRRRAGDDARGLGRGHDRLGVRAWRQLGGVGHGHHRSDRAGPSVVEDAPAVVGIEEVHALDVDRHLPAARHAPPWCAGRAGRRRSRHPRRHEPRARPCRRGRARAPSCRRSPPVERRPSRCASTSEPSASSRSTPHVMRRPSGVPAARAASSRSSGLMPTTTRRPSYAAQRRASVEHSPVELERGRAERHEQAVAVAVERRIDEVHRGRTDEPGDEEVRRAVVQHLRRVDLLQVRPASSRPRGRPSSWPRSGRA